jgi:MFS family permease
MLTFGWASYSDVHWIVPTIGLVLVGLGTTCVVVGNANYLIDAYSKHAASALGAVGVLENMTIAFLPLATPAMYTRLGFHWASALLAFISLAIVIAPLAMLKWGKQIRSRSPFMKEAMVERCTTIDVGV